MKAYSFLKQHRLLLALIAIGAFLLLLASPGRGLRADVQAVDPDYPSKSGYSAKKWSYPTGTIKGEALDEARGGRTLIGTPVTPRTAECFPAEPRDLFWKMDWVAGPDGKLHPLNFDENGDGKVDNEERDAIRGRNTWLLWGGGNEAFWGWLQEKAYGITDFLILLDSRRRGSRFQDAGLINQPGFQSNTQPLLGLYLDAPKADGSAILRPPGPKGEPALVTPGYTPSYNEPEPERYDAQGRELSEPVRRPAPPPGHPTQLFEPWATIEEREKEWKAKNSGDDPFKDYVPDVVRKKLPQGGLDPDIYGYPSGIFGLRLMLNPDFFAKTKEAEKARAYWKVRVEGTNGRYYTESQIHMDPKLVRPFRVSMSCGFCHVAQHPLNPPPKGKENEPEWENLSSIIGAQYWDPQPAFGNVLKPRNFLHHFLKSQAPGTIDTSLVSTDQINNTNVINAIFDVPARLARAMKKPTESQSRENLLLPSIEDPETSNNPDGPKKERHFPMVLFPGEDCVGVFGALARVPLNVGVFSEEWGRCDNPVLGFTPQRPFRIEVARANSVYWNVNEKYRVGYMAKFFTLGASGKVSKSTAPMKLKNAGPPTGLDGNPLPLADGSTPMLGKDVLAADSPTKQHAGREVFLKNCAICHSSKQPEGFDLRFKREWDGGWTKAPAPHDSIYTLPADYRYWEDFKKSDSYANYLNKLYALPDLAQEAAAVEGEDPFIENNFLSNELRIPITLIGTYSGRAMATNAMRGNVWDNYSSETFKNLPSVGKIRFYNPYLDPKKAQLDPVFGTNDEYDDGRTKGGPGYLRPPTLISIWATAPYFHNNALGRYTHDPSVEGRLLAFDDGIRKLLWKEKRPSYPRNERNEITWTPPGDLRADGSASASRDPGYIYRLPLDTFVMFQPAFIRPLIEGLLVGRLGTALGAVVFTILSFWWWVVLTLIYLILVVRGKPRHAGLLLLFLAVSLAVVLALTGAGGVGGTVSGALMMGAANLFEYSPFWWWLAVLALAVGGFLLLMTRQDVKWIVRFIFLGLALVTLFLGILANKFLNGRLKEVNPILAVLPNELFNVDYKGIRIGPLPRGTPVNLLMNMDPQKTDKVAPALVALVRASLEIRKKNLTGDEAYKVFAAKAGPALIAASKCPDFVLDRGHWFGEFLQDEEKEALIAFLKTL